MSLALLYTVPSSLPSIKSSSLLIGQDRGLVSSMKNLVMMIVLAPTASPCLEQIA